MCLNYTQIKMQFDNVHCNYQILDSSHKILLGVCLLIFGALGVLLNLWLLLTFMRSTLLISRNFLFSLAYCIACLARNLIAGFPVSSITAFANKWILGDSGCQFFAFFQLVLGNFQMFCLTALAVERLLKINLYVRGSELSFKLYMGSLVICWFVSILIAVCPLLGFGRYFCDMTDTVCDIDWRMVYTKQIPFNSLLIVFIGIIPFIISIVCLFLAMSKEKYMLNETRNITKVVAILIAFTYLFWTPKAILIFYIVFGLKIPKALLVMSAVSAESATIVPIITYLVYEPTIRRAMIIILMKIISKNTPRGRRNVTSQRVPNWSSNN